MIKTLVGKDGYLFLINDSANEIGKHSESFVPNCNLNIYKNIFEKIFLLVFPDKSYVCRNFLPDEYNDVENCNTIDVYNDYFGNKMVYPIEIIDHTMFYKTDTHMNLFGVYNVLKYFIEHLKKNFNIELNFPEITLSAMNAENGIINLGKGIGDLMSALNKCDLLIENISETYYYSNDLRNIYLGEKINDNSDVRILDYTLNDRTSEFNGQEIDWNIVSKYILHSEQDVGIDKKILVFYDSFSLQILDRLLKISNNVYLMKSSIYYPVINITNPDIILELHVERFLI